MTLWRDFLTNDKKLIHKWKHYFPIYEQHLSRFINRDVILFEIGCGGGGSLQMWKRFLGPHARILGIDINPACRSYEEDQIAIAIGDQSDCDFLQKIISTTGAPDIVIDDGSHVMEHVNKSFSFLYPRVSRNGVYLVEDMHTSYWEEFGGGVKREGTFIEKCKSLIDELNAEHTRAAINPTDFTRTTLSMHFYDSVVVFEKGRHTVKRSLAIGQPSEFYRTGEMPEKFR
jgi:SAM-dependent methyltransferase